MIQCPKCTNKIPDWSQNCQFCHADVKGVLRPKPDPKQARPVYGGPAKWIYPTYYAISAYFVLSGAIDIIQSLVALSKKSTDTWSPGPALYLGIIIGAVNALLGIGLLAKVEAARGIVNVFCWIRIATGLLSLPATIGLGVVFGPFGIVLTVLTIVNIITAALMIYLIGETD